MRDNVSCGGRKSRLVLSVVSHGQWGLVRLLLEDIARYCTGINLEVALTCNIPEEIGEELGRYPLKISLIRNSKPKGFGANHNFAFARSDGEFFCVINPDIRLISNPFPELMEALSRNCQTGVVAPLIRNSRGGVEDSARDFPTPLIIAKRVFTRGRLSERGISGPTPDWVAGMFMVFPWEAFRKVGGFDEKYFLYYEDADMCMRLRRVGYNVLLVCEICAIHDAGRASHRNLKYFRWHAASMFRFFLKYSSCGGVIGMRLPTGGDR